MKRNINAEAQKRYRKGNPGYAVTEAMRVKARYRAMAALTRKYPAEYAKLYSAELQKLQEGE